MIKMEQERAPTLRITASKGLVTLASKYQGDVSIKTIQLKLLWGYCWWNEMPEVETFLNLLEDVIKKVVRDVLPHQELLLNYDLATNDLLEDSSYVEVSFNRISADNNELELIGDVLVLEGFDQRGRFSKMTSFRRKINENIAKSV
jgi:hypothetical protein